MNKTELDETKKVLAQRQYILKVPLEKEKEKTTFTKAYMSLVVLLYFIGAIIGGVLVALAAWVDIRLGIPINTGMFIAYAAYLGGPTATAIAFYAWKSKSENILKIQNSMQQDPAIVPLDSNLTQILANMGGNT